MTHVTIPNRPLPTDNRDINAILANFDAITKVVNGELSADNLENQSIPLSKLETGTILTLLENNALINGSGHRLEIKRVEEQPEAGFVSAFSYISSLTFPTACLFAWIGGFIVYDAANVNPVNPNGVAITAIPSSKNITVTFQNLSGEGRHIHVQIFGLGY